MHRHALLSVRLTPGTTNERELIRRCLAALVADDPALCIEVDPGTGDLIIAASSESRLEMVAGRLMSEFNVNVGPLQVAYRETVTRSADGEIRYVRQTGGRGQFAHVKLVLTPGAPGTGYIFERAVTPDTIPDLFVQAVDEGIREALAHGVLAGYPVDDVQVALCDGTYHDVDSSAATFRIAGAIAFQDAARKAAPMLLEPVMRVEVLIPVEHAMDVAGNLSTRHGLIQSREDHAGTQVIKARVPLSQMLGYGADLDRRSHGRGEFSMHFDHYRLCRPAADDDDDRASFVVVPRQPHPLRDGGVALPEPDDCDGDD